MPCSRLDAEKLLSGLAENVSEADVAATLYFCRCRNTAGVVRIRRVCDEIIDSRRVDPVFTKIFELGKESSQVSGRHITDLVVDLPVKTVSRAVVVVVAQILGVRHQGRRSRISGLEIINPARVVIVASAKQQSKLFVGSEAL